MNFKTCIYLIFLIQASTSAYAQNSRIWATYYGANLEDDGYDVAVDDSGYVYMTGKTASTTGISSGGFQDSIGGGAFDAFLVKFDSQGNRIWATYYGGAGTDEGFSIALDGSGNIFLAGSTNSSTGISSEGFQNSLEGGRDAFLVKFDRNGNRQWATYYGGNSNESGLALELDNLGNIYLGGSTTSTTGISSNGFQNAHGGNVDAYLVKFDSSGTRIWATYFGGMGTDRLYFLTIDPSNTIYITGYTSTTSGISSGGFEGTIGGGGSDAYLAKFSPSGALLWSTYYGGSGDDFGNCITTEPDGSVYLAGKTNSSTGISYLGYQNFPQGNYDNFLVKFTSSGYRLWGTYYGGAGNEESYSISRAQSGIIYLVGSTTSIADISFSGFQTNYGGSAGDAFVAKFEPNGNLFCSTYYGGPGWDRGQGVTTDNSGNIYLSGRTNSVAGISYLGFQNALGGNHDAYLVKLGTCMNVGMEESDSNHSLMLFPNPSNGIFNIDIQIEEGSIEVFNSLGELILQRNVAGQNTNIDLSDKQKGIYFVRIRKKGELIGVGKLMLIE